MGIFSEKLPDGYEIREEENSYNHRTEYRLYYQGQYTGYATFDKKLAVKEAKYQERTRR